METCFSHYFNQSLLKTEKINYIKLIINKCIPNKIKKYISNYKINININLNKLNRVFLFIQNKEEQ